MAEHTKKILVLARDDAREAMRVAAGLTIANHAVQLVFMNRPLTDDEAECEQAEMLELCEIVPQTTVASMQQYFTLLDADALAERIDACDMVINL